MKADLQTPISGEELSGNPESGESPPAEIDLMAGLTATAESLLEGFPHPSMILDTDFQILSMNRLMEALTGCNRDDVIGFHGELVVRSNTGNHLGRLYADVLRSGESISVTGDMLNSYRRKIAIQYSIAPLRDADGKKCGLLAVAEDISNRLGTADPAAAAPDTDELVGHSPEMQKIMDMVPLLARTDASVLITGETGAGKDRFAEIIHRRSERSRFPFIKINCGALPPGLLESELFGHVKGAFTGATRNKPGVFQLADKGTLFLTEIGDMPLPLQVKLLTVLDDRQFVPVGGEESVHTDIRIIAATHRSLKDQVQDNTFREDLFYRLNVLQVHLPPLRERSGDIRYLMDHFLQHFTTALGKTIVGFSPAAVEPLLTYPYPGNIRELRNIVEYAVNVCKKRKITREHLPEYMFEAPPERPAEAAKVSPSGPEAPGVTPPDDGSAGKTWEEIERRMIVETLKKHKGNRTRTAEELGWGRMKLWRRMKQYGLQK